MWDGSQRHFTRGWYVRSQDEDTQTLYISVYAAERTICGVRTKDMLGPDTHYNPIPQAPNCTRCIEAVIREGHLGAPRSRS